MACCILATYQPGQKLASLRKFIVFVTSENSKFWFRWSKKHFYRAGEWVEFPYWAGDTNLQVVVVHSAQDGIVAGVGVGSLNMAKKVKLPTKFNATADVRGYTLADWQSDAGFFDVGGPIYDLVTEDQLSQIQAKISVKDGVSEGMFDGTQDRMWTITMKSTKSRLATFLSLDSAYGLNFQTITYSASQNDMKSIVVAMIFDIPKEWAELLYGKSGDTNLQVVVVHRVKLGFKNFVFQGRGYPYPGGDQPTWAQVVDF